MKTILTLLLSLFILSSTLQAKESDEVDFIALAALMLRDGHTARANDALDQVDLNASDVDLPRFHMLKGMVQTDQTLYKEANGHFKMSIQLNEDKEAAKPLYLYIAQNSFKLEDYDGCIAALDKVPELMEEKPQLFALKTECLWRKDRKDDALALLRLVNEKFPTYWDAYKQRFYYLVSLGLYQSALDDANIYLSKAEPNETITLAFINALRQSGQTDKAIELAEIANLRYLESAKITVLLAHLYLDKEMVQGAAELFDQSSIEDGDYTKESAEIYRRAHDYVMALLKNTEMTETKEKYKQRIALFLEHGDFERIIATEPAMKRSGLMEDENMRYALAYAYYMTADFDETELLLKTLTKPDLFKKATELRKNMERCANNIWDCQQ